MVMESCKAEEPVVMMLMEWVWQWERSTLTEDNNGLLPCVVTHVSVWIVTGSNSTVGADQKYYNKANILGEQKPKYFLQSET